MLRLQQGVQQIMRNWLIAFNCGNAADIITTYYGLALGGREANPIVAWAIAQFGFSGAATLKVIVALYCTILLAHRKSVKTTVFLVILMWLIVLNNLGHIIWRLS